MSLRYLSRLAPGALLLLMLLLLLIFAAVAARAPTPPRPPLWGREVPKKRKSTATALALGNVCVGMGVLGKGTESLAVRPRIAWFLCFLLASSSSAFSLSGSLSPSSQVSQGVLCLLRYDGSGRVHSGKPDVFVSSSLSPWRYEVRLQPAGIGEPHKSTSGFFFLVVVVIDRSRVHVHMPM